MCDIKQVYYLKTLLFHVGVSSSSTELPFLHEPRVPLNDWLAYCRTSA